MLQSRRELGISGWIVFLLQGIAKGIQRIIRRGTSDIPDDKEGGNRQQEQRDQDTHDEPALAPPSRWRRGHSGIRRSEGITPERNILRGRVSFRELIALALFRHTGISTFTRLDDTLCPVYHMVATWLAGKTRKRSGLNALYQQSVPFDATIPAT